MISLHHHPLVAAIVDSWRARLPMHPDGRTPNVGEADLRDLITQLSRAVDLLTESMDTETLIARLTGDTHNAPSLPREHH